jgi:hypothetical protein
LYLNDLGGGPQRFIDSLTVTENTRDIRIEQHNIRPFRVAARILTADTCRKIIVRAHLASAVTFLHIFSAQGGSPALR